MESVIKIGVLCCSFECDDSIDDVLAPWIKFKENSGYNVIFSCAYGPFKEWAQLFNLAFQPVYPQWLSKYSELFKYFVSPVPGTEAENRQLALDPLLGEKCDYILMLDLSDEYYDYDQICRSIEFMEKFPDIYYFDVAFRNFIFDKSHYLDTIYFKRFFRSPKNDPITGMRFDCDYTYASGSDEQKPKMRIPSNILLVNHFSWMSDERGRKKVLYQTKRWGSKLCSYKWEDSLKLNDEYYEFTGKTKPRIHIRAH